MRRTGLQPARVAAQRPRSRPVWDWWDWEAIQATRFVARQSHQALVGIRSTMGLTSRAGVMPLSLLADVAGPLARTVEDAVAVFQTVVGEDPDDAVTRAARDHLPQDYSKSLDRNGLRGAVMGVLHQAYDRPGADAEVVRVFMAAVEALRRAGATIVDPATVEGLEAIERPRGAGPCMGFKYDMNRYLAAQGDRVPVKSLAEIIKSRRLPSLGGAASGTGAERAGEWPGIGRVPGGRGLSGEGAGSGSQDDGQAEAGCLRVSDVE